MAVQGEEPMAATGEALPGRQVGVGLHSFVLK